MQNAETKTCASCQAEFTIEPEDFSFYEKIAVPAPTWCPDCRAQRRLAWRNEWHLFQKPDALTGEQIFSGFSPTSSVKVYANDYWQSDAWDPMDYGREYDFTRPFFTQLHELLQSVPLKARSGTNLENSEYCTNAGWLKNCYLVAVATHTEDSAYMVHDHQSRNCFDNHITESCELSYGNVNLTNCYQTHLSENCEGCSNVTLSRDCVGCRDCFGSVNLRNKQYYIFNKPYTKEAYEAKLRELNLGSYRSLQLLSKQAHELWLQLPNLATQGSSNENVGGEYIFTSKDVAQSYRVRDGEQVKYSQNLLASGSKECYDLTLGFQSELVYESTVCGVGVYNMKFDYHCIHNDRNVQYSMFCEHSSDLFGCVSLRKKQFCIFNNQYTKEEYEALVPRIIEHMNDMPYTDKLGRVYRYGEFFPPELSPVEYNVSFAQEEFPLTREEAIAQGFSWYEQPVRTPTIGLEAADLPDSITDSSPELVGTVIGCAHGGTCDQECTTAFTIIPQEYAFLVEQGLPLPRLCPNCRQHDRITQRRRMKLHTRQCQCAGTESSNGAYTNVSTNHIAHPSDQPCPNEVVTSYPSDRPEIVYCESCYQQEVA